MDKLEAVFSATSTVASQRGAECSSGPLRARRHYPRIVRAWLLAGLVLIFVQVVVGGITRLTGSGLSITRWEIVTGTLPPLNAADWNEAFALYQATPQYAKMNEGMPLDDFKFIYFWEYFHRLWARMMGLVFALPLAYFVWKGYVDRGLGKRLAFVFVAAALTASFGWIMVASGLIERPLVNAYKLSIHLGIAFITFGILLWTVLWAFDIRLSAKPPRALRRSVYVLVGVLIVQILLGGMMSGMKAALAYPTWPDLHGAAVPGVLLQASNWTLDHVIHYDSHPFMSALVQLLHRTAGYAVAGLVLWLLWRNWRVRMASAKALAGAFDFVDLKVRQNPSSGRNSDASFGEGQKFNSASMDLDSDESSDKATSPILASDTNIWQPQSRWTAALWLTAALTLLQVLLGIVTVLLSDYEIPVLWGVLHQAGALFLLSAVLYNLWLVRAEPLG